MELELSSLAQWDAFGRLSGLAVIVTDETGVVQVWSDAAEKLYGWSAEEAIGIPIQDLTVGPLEHKIADEIMGQVMSGRAWEGDFHARTRHGSIAEVHVLDLPLVDDEGRIAGIVGISFDVGAGRSGSSSRLVNLRHLAREIHDARHLERRNIARDLHDDLGQVLTVMRSEISGLVESSDFPLELVAGCDQIKKRVDVAIDLVRDISSELLENTLDFWSLILRAFEMTDEFQDRTGILAICDVVGPVERMRLVEPSVAVVAFHVLREALTNCERHSQSNHVEVLVSVSENCLVVTVEDNGVGIGEQSDGVGMRIMRDRVSQVDGSLAFIDLRSEGQTGTRVRATLPVSRRGARVD